MSKSERRISELLNELIEICEELKTALGKREKVVMGMKVRRIDANLLMQALPALERVLKEYSKGDEGDVEWMSIVASFDPESQRILEVYHPKGWSGLEMKSKTCKLCDHPQVRAMEDDFLAGLNDAEVAQKYGVSDRTWRAHRQHSGVLNHVKGELEVVGLKPIELPSLQLTSDEIRMLSIWHLCQSVERLSEVARSSGSVRAEQALGDNIMKLNQLTKGLEFERPKQSSAEDYRETW